MGLLGKLFGSEPEHPPLDPSSTAASRIAQNQAALEGFANKVHDKLQVVPGERAVYVFIGRPPEAFGVVWFEKDGQEHNFKTMMKDRGIDQKQVGVIAEHLRQAYVKHQDEPRFASTLGSKKVVVIPSPGLEKDVAAVIHEAD